MHPGRKGRCNGYPNNEPSLDCCSANRSGNWLDSACRHYPIWRGRRKPPLKVLWGWRSRRFCRWVCLQPSVCEVGRSMGLTKNVSLPAMAEIVSNGAAHLIKDVAELVTFISWWGLRVRVCRAPCPGSICWLFPGVSQRWGRAGIPWQETTNLFHFGFIYNIYQTTAGYSHLDFYLLVCISLKSWS